jgi:hypothetical protein
LGLVSLVWMERMVGVVFGPSRSQRFGKAVAEAHSGAGECAELGPGRYRARFVLGSDAAVYSGLARLLERVRHWRATEVCEDDEPVSVFHAREMAWCASCQLQSFGECRWRFEYGVLPRCALCPLFDAERAIRDGLGRHQPQAPVLEIISGAELQALLRECLSDLDPGWQVPDFPPAEWGEPEAEQPPG